MITCPSCNKKLDQAEVSCPHCSYIFANGPWVVILKAYPPEDRITESLIRSFNVPVRLIQESIAPVTGITIGPLAEVKIAVPQVFASYVLDLLSAPHPKE